jgi:hypothetical protein
MGQLRQAEVNVTTIPSKLETSMEVLTALLHN